MVDRISNLPEAVLWHILSFLPTKQVVATSVLSKRWNPLWLSVPTLDFVDYDYANKDKYSCFVEFVYAVILSRDSHKPIKKFRLCCSSSLCNPTNVKIWVNAALKGRVEHLELSLPMASYNYKPYIIVPSAVFIHRTLVVLKLTRLVLKTASSVDLPSLKILHLESVRFLEPRYLAELLSGCPILENLVENYIYFDNNLNEAEFKRLNKLVRADITSVHILLEAINNVECLCIKNLEEYLVNDKEMDMINEEEAEPCVKDLIPVFHNLTRIKLSYFNYVKDWFHVVEVINHCPKLRRLVIIQAYFDFFHCDYFEEYDEGREWPYPQSVPKSISLQLKTCRIHNYTGSRGELQFARYIMQNAGLLQSMTINVHFQANQQQELKMIKELSVCTRRSKTCKLLIK